MFTNLIFLLGVALLFTHELDAIQKHEWRLFPVLRSLDDKTAFRAFTLAHAPLFLLFLWLVAYPSLWAAVAVDLFLIVHVGLHAAFRNRPLYEFGRFSHAIIIAAGLAGAAHLLLLALA